MHDSLKERLGLLEVMEGEGRLMLVEGLTLKRFLERIQLELQ
jgi:hypothetical protein